jgi:hypothetical protein
MSAFAAGVLRIHLLAFAVLLGGCAGGEILSLNGDLTRLQREKTTLEAQIPSLKGSARDAAVVELTNVEGQLERVADSAYASARRPSDTKARIANYRLAAMADWQRGHPRAVTVAREGVELCSSGTGYDIAPRDCAILAIIPDLLVNDIWVVKFEVARTEGARGVAGLPAKYRDAINDLLRSYIELDRVAARVGGAGVHPLMIDMIRSRRDTVARNIDRYVELFVTRGISDADRVENAAICADIRRDAPAILPRRCGSLLSQPASRT